MPRGDGSRRGVADHPLVATIEKETMSLNADQLRLISDFPEFYDHAFAGSHQTGLPIWRRNSKTTRTRQHDHELLRAVGFDTPRNAPLREWPAETMVVIYTDPTAHRGEGKCREKAGVMLERGFRRDIYAVEWIDSCTRASSRRLLAVGSLFLWFSYYQFNPLEWRSNVGDHVLVMLEARGASHRDSRNMRRLQYALGEPLVAVDFIMTPAGRHFAIGLNTAPGLSELYGEWSPEEIAGYIAACWGELYGKPEVIER